MAIFTLTVPTKKARLLRPASRQRDAITVRTSAGPAVGANAGTDIVTGCNCSHSCMRGGIFDFLMFGSALPGVAELSVIVRDRNALGQHAAVHLPHQQGAM